MGTTWKNLASRGLWRFFFDFFSIQKTWKFKIIESIDFYLKIFSEVRSSPTSFVDDPSFERGQDDIPWESGVLIVDEV